ncbi:GNAT family N-acetyltransferase [uncultured Sphingomonas sp.]|jgi:RimJ/RimL family protein N-acetyltransferase|uniref:GNAT family N-acetyltransferase n=1 Tax=unclassified Sphingomonas TaxID=196159 RepID=UPI0025CFB0E8|nr:GNAT family N-acetyltransferase [uncultured Sphingomonas sp.]
MFARTKRLTLRPSWPEEAETLTQAIAHEEVAMKLARLPWPYSVGDAEAFLAVPRGPTDARFFILAHDGSYPRMVGGIGLNATGRHTAELGYWLTPQAWGRGYATEAGRAVIDMARHALPLRRIEASHHLDNPASRRVLEKLGFREVRRQPLYSLARGGEVDCAVLALDLEGEAEPARMRIAA